MLNSLISLHFGGSFNFLIEMKLILLFEIAELIEIFLYFAALNIREWYLINIDHYLVVVSFINLIDVTNIVNKLFTAL
jgi:hypothetical protein